MNAQELIDAINQQWEERLDKIRAEIEPQRNFYHNSMDYCDAVGEEALNWVLEIIDKYTKEQK